MDVRRKGDFRLKAGVCQQLLDLIMCVLAIMAAIGSIGRIDIRCVDAPPRVLPDIRAGPRWA